MSEFEKALVKAVQQRVSELQMGSQTNLSSLSLLASAALTQCMSLSFLPAAVSQDPESGACTCLS